MQFIDWQPGNTSRYPLVFGRLPSGGWLIAYLKSGDVTGPSFKWYDDYIDLGYMMEKMKLSEYDAQAIGAFLFTQGVEVNLGWGRNWRHFDRAEELGFDKLLKAS